MLDPSHVGGALLGAATVPQAVRLVRTRNARDFAWAFVLLNFVGLVLLAWRSAQIAEWGFLAINTMTASFWGLVAVVKMLSPLAPNPA